MDINSQVVNSIEVEVRDYYVRTGVSPEDVSYDLFGTTEYWPIILFINRIKSLDDWPKSYQELRGSIENPDTIVTFFNTQEQRFADHNELTFLIGLQEVPNNWRPYTKNDLAFDLNEKKRNIKVISKQTLSGVING